MARQLFGHAVQLREELSVAAGQRPQMVGDLGSGRARSDPVDGQTRGSERASSLRATRDHIATAEGGAKLFAHPSGIGDREEPAHAESGREHRDAWRIAQNAFDDLQRLAFGRQLQADERQHRHRGAQAFEQQALLPHQSVRRHRDSENRASRPSLLILPAVGFRECFVAVTAAARRPRVCLSRMVREMARRPCLVAVHAHPDDESSKGAATIAQYAARGASVAC